MHAAPIDLAPFRTGAGDDRRRVAEQFDAAGRESGFVTVTGHGIDPSLIDDMVEVTTAFFDLPIEEKMRWYVDDRAKNRGYAPLGSEALAYSLGERDLPRDLFEAFNAGRELTAEQLADPYFAVDRDRFYAENVWPDTPPGMRATWLEYWSAVERLGHEIMSVAAVALGLDADHFAPVLDRTPSVIRANNYERHPGAPPVQPGQMRMGAHSDYGSITILLADRVPGLQIRDDGGRWFDVLPPADGFVVNIGDLLAEWTNDRWRSTLHRVVPPDGGDGPARRRSIAFFQQPNHDAMIECLPTCTDVERPPRYARVSSGDHLIAKLMGPRLLRPSETSPAYAPVADEP